MAPSKPTVSYSPSTFEVGARVDLTCNVSPADPAFTYSWTMDGTTLTGQTSQTVTYVAFGLADFGDYVCTVHHGSLSSSASDAVTVAAQCKCPCLDVFPLFLVFIQRERDGGREGAREREGGHTDKRLSLIHISEPTRR